jgi:DNA repair exonuclease SbcCD ATPase subunit
MIFLLFSGKDEIKKSQPMLNQLLKDNEQHAANLSALRAELEKKIEMIENFKTYFQDQKKKISELTGRHNEAINKCLEILKDEQDSSVFTSYQKHIEYFEGQVWKT